MASLIGQTDSEKGKGVVEESDATRKMYEDSRNVLYRWAGSWAGPYTRPLFSST